MPGYRVSEIDGVAELWAETRGDANVCVAVLDGPVDLAHPSFAGADLNQIGGLVPQSPGSGGALRHGTHIASLIFGQPDGPVEGLAPGCRGLIIPIFADEPAGEIGRCSQTDLGRAVAQAGSAGAHIINVSSGQPSETGEAHPLLAAAVEHCAENGILIVAAAGNDGCACLQVPGALPAVIAVGAMTGDGEPAEFSNWGDRYQSQGILAPGVSVLGAEAGNGTIALTGTSYAAAIVSGVAALLMSLQLKLGEEPDALIVRRALLDSARGCEAQPAADCRQVLAGRLDVRGAVQRLKSRGNAMSGFEKISQGETTANGIGETAAPAQDRELALRSASATAPLSPRPRAAAISTVAGPMSPGGITPLNLGAARAAGCTCAPGESCSCGAAAAMQKALALGTLDIGFRSIAEHDSFAQHLNGHPRDIEQTLAYLERNPWDAASVQWILKSDETPLYAVLPFGAFARDGYDRLRQILREQVSEGVERVAVAGYVFGSTPLMTGEMVPFLVPELRCMYSWTTAKLVEAVCGRPPAANAAKETRDAYDRAAAAIRNFLERIYHELRGFGTDPRDRARIYAATNALNVSHVFADALKEDLQLDSIDAVPSPIGREGFEYWDVRMLFFDPRRQFERARREYRFAVDLSQPCPVMVGPIRSWDVSAAYR